MEEIEVDTYEYKKTEAPNILRSGGLGPCVVVGAIYGKKGYMAHYVPFGTIPTELKELLKDLEEEKKAVGSLQGLEIYVAGGGIQSGNPQEVVDSTLKGRQECLDEITKAGFEKYIKKIQWAKLNHDQELILYLSERKADYDEYEIPLEHLGGFGEEDQF